MSDLILVRSSDPLTASIARISFDDDLLRVYFPETKNQSDAGRLFNEVIKRHDFHWQRPYWARRIDEDVRLDRAAEIAHVLLAARLCVKGPRDVMDAAVAQSFAPEPVRTIRREDEGEYAGWFRIWWHIDRGGELKPAVRNLPGARWATRWYVVVPPEQWRAVLDFAEMYECYVSPGAQALAEEAQAEEEAALVIDVAPMEETAVDMPQPGARPPKLDVPENVEIDEELLDV